ncbi:hypothetical protein Q73_15110 [Bacillus coahuilensis m2-6]|uniref:DUF2521 family protein n=1 Tax=Bacillus coahuilensis TaxID=408580 RepID=UPI00018508AC|nr:DUF2521 family protein [Bacillus coahuilensis]KUP04654.1 hypothetical protein Q73_15110 [Bacillus coahuilensis m2-6]
MMVITTFEEKRKDKQMKLERKLLKELSIKKLTESVQSYFGNIRIRSASFYQEGFNEACYDVAVESYLIGGKISRLGRYGETAEQSKLRVNKELKHFSDTLFNFWLYWSEMGVAGQIDESLYYTCEQFVNHWWQEGYQAGIQRQKLRLH